jgi:hypothetical protein
VVEVCQNVDLDWRGFEDGCFALRSGVDLEAYAEVLLCSDFEGRSGGQSGQGRDEDGSGVHFFVLNVEGMLDGIQLI